MKLPRLLIGACALVALALLGMIFLAYLQPELMVNLSEQIRACF